MPAVEDSLFQYVPPVTQLQREEGDILLNEPQKDLVPLPVGDGAQLCPGQPLQVALRAVGPQGSGKAVDGEQMLSLIHISPEAAQWAEQDFLSLYEGRDENFGNARDVRNLFEKAVSRQSDRVAQLESPTREQLMELRVEDLNETETA